MRAVGVVETGISDADDNVGGTGVVGVGAEDGSLFGADEDGPGIVRGVADVVRRPGVVVVFCGAVFAGAFLPRLAAVRLSSAVMVSRRTDD